MRPMADGALCVNHTRGQHANAIRDKARRAGGKARGEQQRQAARGALDEGTQRPDWWKLQQPWDVAGGLASVAQRTIAGRLDAKRGAVAVKALVALLPLTARYYRADEKDTTEGGERDEADEAFAADPSALLRLPPRVVDEDLDGDEADA